MGNKDLSSFIVITSINQPTEAIKKFSERSDHNLIVVGDKKTPGDWGHKNVDFISTDNQLLMDWKILKDLPFNHYSRKMIGYLTAIKNGATLIVDTDDDNIPKEDWDFPSLTGRFLQLKEGLGFVNIYQHFTKEPIWPRGFPLKGITKKFDFANDSSYQNCNIGIWQGLADEDPDVDAIYRLTSDKPCFFDHSDPIVLNKGSICPFNTQNTIIRKELFPLLFLPTTVSFRFTDILRGLVAQPIIWLNNFQLGFTHATVVQKRNPHDYMSDFLSELPMFENIEKVISIASSSISEMKSINDNLYNSYFNLSREKIVKENELANVEAWLTDVTGC